MSKRAFRQFESGSSRSDLFQSATMSKEPSLGRLAGALAFAALAGGCDPVVNVYGSFFPAWLICLLLGVAIAAILRLVFAWTELEEHMAPLLLVYPSLAVLMASLSWLLLFRH